MASAEDKLKIKKFLQQNFLGVLSTTDKKHRIDAAPVYILVDPELNIYFVTPEKTQKAKNLKAGSEAVITVFKRATNETVQIRGEAVVQPEKFTEAVQILSGKLTTEEVNATTLPILKYKKQKKIAMKVAPTFIGYRKYGDGGIEEITVDNF